MSYALAIRYQAEPVRTLAYGSISGTYAGIGTGMANPIRQFLVTNNTNVLLMFSFDGINDHFPLLSGAAFVSDITSNAAVTQGWYLSEGQRLYVRAVVGSPSAGAVYLSVFYGSNT